MGDRANEDEAKARTHMGNRRRAGPLAMAYEAMAMFSAISGTLALVGAGLAATAGDIGAATYWGFLGLVSLAMATAFAWYLSRRAGLEFDDQRGVVAVTNFAHVPYRDAIIDVPLNTGLASSLAIVRHRGSDEEARHLMVGEGVFIPSRRLRRIVEEASRRGIEITKTPRPPDHGFEP